MDEQTLRDSDPRKHIVLSQQFTTDYLSEIFDLANKIRDNPREYSSELKGKVISLLFYEPSTRTRLSFESAVKRLGGEVMVSENASEFSSVSKGETLQDTIKTVCLYSDMVVMRHYEDDSSKRAVAVTTKPLINAGSGKSQHPTQALLDVYTIHREFGKLENLVIAVVGDLLRGRTCDSLVYLLSKYEGNQFYFVSPKNSRVKDSLREYLDRKEIRYVESENLNEVLTEVDVCYMTRIQKERFSSTEEYEEAKGQFILTNENVDLMRENAIVMHPLPRVDEISTEVDDNKRARYFEQMENGLYVRMALLKVLNDNC